MKDKPKQTSHIMKVSEMENLFRLAGLKPPESEADRKAAAADLQDILGSFQKIQEVDTKAVEPLFNPLSDRGQTAPLREDRAAPLPPEEKEALLNQAPQKEGGLIKTPPVLSHKSKN